MAVLALFSLLTLACIAIQATPLPPESRIVGGNVASTAQFPYMASLRDVYGHRCGGSILNKRWILTAAHCVDFYKSPSEVNVHVGTNLSHEKGTKYEVSKIIVHKGWNPVNINSDIAMLKLKTNVVFTSLVQPIDFARSEIAGGKPVVVSGWGVTKYPSNTPSPVLKYLEKTVVGHNQCLIDLFPNQVHGSNICAISRDGGACSGDSGSPLVYDHEVAGIASWVMPCGVGYPDVYTKVSFFANWIQNNIDTL